MLFSDHSQLKQTFAGKRVVVVGSGPGVLDNKPGFIDSFDVVCRVNNYKTSNEAGFRTDVFYSFFGSSIKKKVHELKADGVNLCMCKCPNAKFMESDWHRKRGKEHGVDFRYIYENRASWWFTPTYVPTLDEFVEVFRMLDGHIPSTGFSALLAVMEAEPTTVHATGFDFFSSRIHNVNEPWRPANPDDPIGHAPELERAWLAKHLDKVTMDKRLTEIMQAELAQ